MILESLSDFAQRLGVNKSTVSRWKAAERLVVQDGKVVVEDSLERLEATKGGRDDLAERHRLAREAKAMQGGEAAGMDSDNRKEALRQAALDKALSEARIKQAEADMREMARDKEAGNLIAKEDVDYVLNDLGALLRSLFDGRAERLGAELGLSQDQITAMAEADEALLHDMADRLQAKAAE